MGRCGSGKATSIASLLSNHIANLSLQVHKHTHTHTFKWDKRGIWAEKVSKEFIEVYKLCSSYFSVFFSKVCGNNLIQVPAEQSRVFTSAPKVRLFDELLCHVVDAIDSRGEKLSQYGQWQCIPRAAELEGKLCFVSRGAVCAKSSVKVIFRQRKFYIRINHHSQLNTSISANPFRYKSGATFPCSMSFFFWRSKSK